MPEKSGFTITPLERVRARLVPHDWAWACRNAAAIERNWQRRLAERPDLFDGVVLLACGCAIREGACEVAFFETRYSRFIAFRDAGFPDPGVENAFAAIVPSGTDGAVLLGEMAGHTANACQIYFACGTPDREDVRPGGHVDLAGSAAREFSEETGLAIPAGAEDGPWLLVRGEGHLAFLRPVALGASAADLVARVDAHRRTEDVPELARMIVVRGRADIDSGRMPGFVQAYLADLFKT